MVGWVVMGVFSYRFLFGWLSFWWPILSFSLWVQIRLFRGLVGLDGRGVVPFRVGFLWAAYFRGEGGERGDFDVEYGVGVQLSIWVVSSGWLSFSGRS